MKKPLWLLEAWAFCLLLVFSTSGPISAADSVVGVRFTPNPLMIAVSAPESVLVDRNFQILATVENRGDINIEAVSASNYLPTDFKFVSSKRKQSIGNMLPHSAKTISWQVKATKEGKYIVTVKASGTHKGIAISDEDSFLINVVKKSK